jgi:hypothetical protein
MASRFSCYRQSTEWRTPIFKLRSRLGVAQTPDHGNERLMINDHHTTFVKYDDGVLSLFLPIKKTKKTNLGKREAGLG